MDTDAIRQIPIEDFLSRLGHEPVKRSGNELWYSAPYRSERTPSFHVNVEKQVWYDFGLGKGGDIFTLAGEFIHSTDFLTQARFIAEAAGTPLAGMERKPPRPKPPGAVFEKVEVFPLFRSALTDYLAERGIPYEVASRHCCRLDYGVHGKRYYAVGFPNMAGGYEIRNRFFKGCIPPKQVSLVRQKETPAEVCCVFEGFMDFLSALTLGLGGAGDHLVLNSVTNVKRATEYLDSYRGIECFLDRDEAGRKALETLLAYYGRRITDRSPLYEGCKDLNEYLQQFIRKQKKNNLKIKRR